MRLPKAEQRTRPRNRAKRAQDHSPEATRKRILAKLARRGTLTVGERLWLKSHLTTSELEGFLWDAVIESVLK